MEGAVGRARLCGTWNASLKVVGLVAPEQGE